MKAKELKEKAFCEGFYENNEHVNLYVFTEEEMAIFWSQLCKEQRIICNWEIPPLQDDIAENVLNAPEPDIE